MSDGTFNVYCVINSYLTILHIASVKSPNSMNLKTMQVYILKHPPTKH